MVFYILLLLGASASAGDNRDPQTIAPCLREPLVQHARDLPEQRVNHFPYTNMKKKYLQRGQLPGLTNFALARFPGRRGVVGGADAGADANGAPSDYAERIPPEARGVAGPERPAFFPEHVHDTMFEVFIVRNGTGTFSVGAHAPVGGSAKPKGQIPGGQHSLDAERGDLLYLPPGLPHSGVNSGGGKDWNFIVLAFEVAEENLLRFPQDYGFHRPHDPELGGAMTFGGAGGGENTVLAAAAGAESSCEAHVREYVGGGALPGVGFVREITVSSKSGSSGQDAGGADIGVDGEALLGLVETTPVSSGHGFYVVYYLLHGRAEISLAGKVHLLLPDSVVVVPPHGTHFIRVLSAEEESSSVPEKGSKGGSSTTKKGKKEKSGSSISVKGQKGKDARSGEKGKAAATVLAGSNATASNATASNATASNATTSNATINATFLAFVVDAAPCAKTTKEDNAAASDSGLVEHAQRDLAERGSGVSSPGLRRGSGADPAAAAASAAAASSPASSVQLPPPALQFPPPAVQLPPPAWTRGEMERPAGTRHMEDWVAAVYTPEQQARLNVDEEGNCRTDFPVLKGGKCCEAVLVGGTEEGKPQSVLASSATRREEL